MKTQRQVPRALAGAGHLVRRRPRAAVALLFALLALAGLLAVRQTGPGLDDRIERITLGINIRAYAGALGLADKPFFADLPQDDLRSWRDRDYGQARFYPIWPVMNALERAGRPGAASLAYYYYNYLIFLLGLFALYALLLRLCGSRAAGALGVLLLFLNPRFFAASFYNTKDMPFMALCLVVFWLGLRFAGGQGFGSAVWFGLAGAVAANGRLLGAAAFGLAGIFYLARLTLQKRWSARAFWRGAAAVGAFAGFWLLLTPAAWPDPLGFLSLQLGQTANFDPARYGFVVLYRGALYDPAANPIPWHYIPWLMLITTPVLLLLLAAAWPVLLAAKNGRRAAGWKSDETLFTLAAGLFSAAPVVYAMLRRPNLYTGWRQLYFVYGPLVLFAALAVHRLWQLAKGAAPGRRRVLCGLLAAALALHLGYYGGFVARYGPLGGSYFNLLAGPHPEQRYDTDYWNTCLHRLMDEMQKRDPVFSVVPLNPASHVSANWYVIAEMGPPMAEGCEELVWERRGRARYVVENTSYSAIQALRPFWDESEAAVAEWERLMAKQSPVYQLRCGNTVVWRVYQNPQYNGPSPETRAQPAG